MTRLYIALGIVGLLCLSHGLAYIKGRSDVTDKARIEQLQRDLKAVQEAYDREQMARQKDAEQAARDMADAEDLQHRIQELEDAISDRDGVCLDSGDADGLRDLIGRPGP